MPNGRRPGRRRSRHERTITPPIFPSAPAVAAIAASVTTVVAACTVTPAAPAAALISASVALGVSYVWAMSHHSWNSLMHALHGNTTTRLVTRLYTEGMPVLGTVDETSFISWTIDFRGWCKSNAGLYSAIIDRGVDEKGDPNTPNPENEAEGLKYLCAAISDPDIRASVATKSAGSGVKGYAELVKIVLQGTEEQPTIETMLDKMRYNAPDSIISFKIKWLKHADALDPKPAARILTKRFTTAVARNTGSMFDDCIAAVAAQNIDDDTEKYMNLLTKLCSRKLERANDPDINAHKAQATDTIAELKEQLTALRAEVNKSNSGRPPHRPGGRSPASRPANRTKDTAHGDRDKKIQCVRCTKIHVGGRKNCRLPPKECPFVLPDGTTCNGDHDVTFCFFKDPSKCRDPKFRSLIDKKLERMKTTSMSAHKSLTDDEDDVNGFCSACLADDDNHDGPHTPDVSGNTINVTALHTSAAGTNVLHIDTCASDHIVHDPRCLTGVHSPVNTKIRTGNAVTQAVSRGPATFLVYTDNGATYALTRTVIYAPAFAVNLFSVMKEFREFGTITNFDSRCHMMLNTGKSLPFTMSKGVPVMPFRYPPGSADATADATSLTTAHSSVADTWHRRYGHQSYSKIMQLPHVVASPPLPAKVAGARGNR